ncbi:MAG: hypothetical protein H6711_27310 [Myxococcales bacterium]|nr:hypothetical protein [Myxococcales bacterium]
MSGRAQVLAPALALALACGVPAAGVDERASPAPSEEPPEPAATPALELAAACEGPPQRIGGLEELPGDLRLAALIDAGAPDLDVSIARLEGWARGEGGGDGVGEAPIVAGLALSQLGLQLAMLRALLDPLDLRPPEILLLQGPGGETIWLWRQACDLERVRALYGERWGLRTRSLVGGVIGEAIDPTAFAFDLLLLPGDRQALVPAGRGLDLLRWLTAPRPAATGLGVSTEGEPAGALLGALEAAPIRVLIGARAPRGQVLTPEGAAADPLLIRGLADRLEIGGSLPPP